MGLFRKRAPTSRVLVRNGTDKPLLFIFEPWCWTTELLPDASVICEAAGTRPGCLEVEYTADSVTVYGWDTCVARVLTADGQVMVSLYIPVPDFIGMDEERPRRVK